MVSSFSSFLLFLGFLASYSQHLQYRTVGIQASSLQLLLCCMIPYSAYCKWASQFIIYLAVSSQFIIASFHCSGLAYMGLCSIDAILFKFLYFYVICLRYIGWFECLLQYPREVCWFLVLGFFGLVTTGC